MILETKYKIGDNIWCAYMGCNGDPIPHQFHIIKISTVLTARTYVVLYMCLECIESIHGMTLSNTVFSISEVDACDTQVEAIASLIAKKHQIELNQSKEV